MIIRLIPLLYILLFTPSLICATLQIQEFNYLTREVTDNILVNEMSFSLLDASASNRISDATPVLQSVVAEGQNKGIVGQVLNHPNPFRAKEGTTIGYYLSDNMDVTLHIYDLSGSRIYDQTYPAGSNGGKGGSAIFNEIRLTTFSHRELPTGVYYYILMSDQRILGRGKMAVIP